MFEFYLFAGTEREREVINEKNIVPRKEWPLSRHVRNIFAYYHLHHPHCPLAEHNLREKTTPPNPLFPLPLNRSLE